MKIKLVLLAFAFLGVIATGISSPWASDPNPGASDIVIKGGDRGNVAFPHRRHQQVLTDCNTCHELFPQKTGSIEALKAEDRLKPKQVMNKLCTSCHRQYKSEGKKSGPVTCTQCHER